MNRVSTIENCRVKFGCNQHWDNLTDQGKDGVRFCSACEEDVHWCTSQDDVIKELRKQFALDWKGIHGASHWARVRENGLRLAEATQARTDVVELFAFLHDSMRVNDDFAPYHGTRSAHYAESLRGKFFDLDDDGLSLLKIACEGHSDGLMDADITVQICWDSDRLDLGRVGITPDPRRLCTTAAKEADILEWAYARSIKDKR